ncbi:tetratricopeptide repeat-containing sensor histidine kinase [Hymenobacter norwichensis]|uniref:tetratricopeptide repeat-containing sensor histidine kinase n=1 Tax=Hymenobacter norwichensis TaxID=223903 RepID=UPI0003B5E52B|nr:histidine kinase dimerization/phosphoacceptor domain -containing protein [Hymenobacter norwichensis]
MKRLLLLLLCGSWLTSQAEPLYPLLSAAALDSLHAQLRQSRPDTNRVHLLLQLGTDVLARSEELDTDFRPAWGFYRQAQALSATLRYQTGLITCLYLQGRLQSTAAADTTGLRSIRRGIQLSQLQHRPRLEALGWYYLGNAYPRVAQYFPLSIVCFQRSGNLFRQLGRRPETAYMLKQVADMHLLQGHSGLAVHELEQAVALYKAAGHPKLHYSYDLLLAANRQLGDYKEALRYGLATIENAQTTHDTVSIAGFYSRVAALYNELGETDQALRYYQKVLRNNQLTHSSEVATAGDIAGVLIQQGKPQQALDFYLRTTKGKTSLEPRVHAQRLATLYVALKRYPEAEQQYAKVLALPKSKPLSDMSRMYLNQTLGQFYLLTKRYGKARGYFQQALQESEHSGFLVGKSRLHLLLFRADSAQGNFPAAIAHYQQYKALNDSVFNDRKNQQVARLQVQYDTRKKEQNIALLTKQTLLQQSSLQQKDFQRNALLTGAVLLTLLLGLGYNRYRLKQRSNLLLEAQQQEINQQNQSLQHVLSEKEALLLEKDWMLKEIHHRVKNNLQVISSLLDTQSDYLSDPAALAALREGQNRVHAMALIHQKLYQSTCTAGVAMAEYIREITDHLLDSFDHQDTVRTQLAVEPVELNINLATPLGLILNEVLTNALKYAFPPPRRGIISITLTSLGHGHYQLVVADDGIGFPPGFMLEDHRTMGLTIVQGLASQLNGALHISQTDGVRISLEFAVGAKVANPALLPV